MTTLIINFNSALDESKQVLTLQFNTAKKKNVTSTKLASEIWDKIIDAFKDITGLSNTDDILQSISTLVGNEALDATFIKKFIDTEIKEMSVDTMTINCQLLAQPMPSGSAAAKINIIEFCEPDGVLKAVKNNAAALKYAAKELRNDREFILQIVEQNGFALEFVDATFKADKEIVLAAVQQNFRALKFAKDNAKDDNIVLAAVQQNGLALKHGGSFKADKNVVLAAVQQNGLALQFAQVNAKTKVNLKADKDIVLAAVQQNGLALQHGGSFKADKDVVLAAVQQNRQAFKFVDDSIKHRMIISQKRGEPIVFSHNVVTEEQRRALESLAQSTNNRFKQIARQAGRAVRQ